MKKFSKITLTAISCVLLFCILILLGLQAGASIADRHIAWKPNYEKVDITEILKKSTLSSYDYEIIYKQTGLTQIAVDSLLEKEASDTVMQMQEQFFSEKEIKCINWAPFSYVEHLSSDRIDFADIENGDILISSTTHISCYRMGHAAMVVDAENGIITRSIGINTSSALSTIDSFSNRANVLVLRPKLDKEVRNAVAQFAKNELLQIPYDATVGILSPKYDEESCKKTQCAHLVWYAYMKEGGIDIDSNGGMLVTPQDIANSDKLEVVQVYGFNPETLWK